MRLGLFSNAILNAMVIGTESTIPAGPHTQPQKTSDTNTTSGDRRSRRAIDAEWLADRFGFGRPEVRAMLEAARSRPAFIEAFAALCMRTAGKARWAEKTPRNIGRIEAVFHQAPYGIPSGWSTYEEAMSESIQSVR